LLTVPRDTVTRDRPGRVGWAETDRRPAGPGHLGPAGQRVQAVCGTSAAAGAAAAVKVSPVSGPEKSSRATSTPERG